MDKEEIKARLDDLGIEYDARMSAENLAKLLPDETMDKPTEAKPAPANVMSARVLRDYWPTENQLDRVRKGQIVNVTAVEMIEGLEAGTLERVK